MAFFCSGYSWGHKGDTHHYSSVGNKWTKKANMPMAGYGVFVCLLPDNNNIIIGAGNWDKLYK